METYTEFKSEDYYSMYMLLMKHHTWGDLATTGSDKQLNGLSKASLCQQRLKIKMLFVEKLGRIKKWWKMEKWPLYTRYLSFMNWWSTTTSLIRKQVLISNGKEKSSIMQIINVKGNTLRVNKNWHFAGWHLVQRKRDKSEWTKTLNVWSENLMFCNLRKKFETSFITLIRWILKLDFCSFADQLNSKLMNWFIGQKHSMSKKKSRTLMNQSRWLIVWIMTLISIKNTF